MRLALRVEMPLGAHAVARAAVARVVDVEAVLAPRREAAHVGHYAHLVADLVEVRRSRGLVALGGLQIRRGARRVGGHALAAGERRRGQHEQRSFHFLRSIDAAFFL